MPFLTDLVLTPGTHSGSPQPTIPTDDGLVLRPWTATEGHAVHAVCQDPVLQ